MAQVGVSVHDGPFMKGAESRGHGGFPRWEMWDAPFKDSFCGTIETCWTAPGHPIWNDSRAPFEDGCLGSPPRLPIVS